MLLNNLLEDVLQWDKKDNLNKKRAEKKGVHQERLQYAHVGLVLISGKKLMLMERDQAPMIFQVCLGMTKSNS